MTVLDLKRVLEPDVEIEYVVYTVDSMTGNIDEQFTNADLEDEVKYIDVINRDTIRVTI